MGIHDQMGERMKRNYESISDTRLMRRTPVAVRIDGRSFHTFTRGMRKPFDVILMDSMYQTLKYLCENIQGATLGYTQSDEMTIILCDYQTLETDAWFDYRTQKVCSIAASMATMKFNKVFSKLAQDYIFDCKTGMMPQSVEIQEENYKYQETLKTAMEKGAMFDARCFNIPKEEVTNLLYWRQVDAVRNSIQSCGQAYFSQKRLEGKSCKDIKDMLFAEKHMTWENLPLSYQRGVACRKGPLGWYIDQEIPMFHGENRDYVEQLINFEGE